jgi:TPP-dependent pyruvate/acetoin dehydrogenase alpha subunit
MRGYGSVSWEHAFPQDRETYRSRQRKKEEERERLRKLEEAVMKTSEVARKALEREKALKATMNEQIRKAVELDTADRQHQPRLSLVEKQLCFYGGAYEAR